MRKKSMQKTKPLGLSDAEMQSFGAVAVELALHVTSLGKTHGYCYEPFAGFPGFWQFCGHASAAFVEAERAASGSLDDDYIECVNKYANILIERCHESPPGEEEMKKMAMLVIEGYLQQGGTAPLNGR